MHSHSQHSQTKLSPHHTEVIQSYHIQTIIPKSHGYHSILETYVNGKIFETFADTKIPSGFSILDIGASGGGSSNFLREAYKSTLGSTFGAGKTLGLDIDPAKVKKCINSGHECIRGDATRLSQNKIKVK